MADKIYPNTMSLEDQIKFNDYAREQSRNPPADSWAAAERRAGQNFVPPGRDVEKTAPAPSPKLMDYLSQFGTGLKESFEKNVTPNMVNFRKGEGAPRSLSEASNAVGNFMRRGMSDAMQLTPSGALSKLLNADFSQASIPSGLRSYLGWDKQSASNAPSNAPSNTSGAQNINPNFPSMSARDAEGRDITNDLRKLTMDYAAKKDARQNDLINRQTDRESAQKARPLADILDKMSALKEWSKANNATRASTLAAFSALVSPQQALSFKDTVGRELYGKIREQYAPLYESARNNPAETAKIRAQEQSALDSFYDKLTGDRNYLDQFLKKRD